MNLRLPILTHLRVRLPTGVAMAALLACGGLARATPVYQTLGSVNTHAHTFGPTPIESLQNADTFSHLNQPAAMGATSLSLSTAVTNGGRADGSVVSAPGTLKAWAKASYPAYSTTMPWNGYAASEVTSFFADTIQVTGAGLANGTHVLYTLSYFIDGWVTQPAFEMGGPFQAEVSADVRLRNSSNEAARSGWSSRSDANGWYSVALDAVVGEELLISASLSAIAYVSAYATVGHVAEADYGHSAHFYLAPSVAGLNVIGASGHDFAMATQGSSVPEPGSLALSLCALALTGAAARRRAQSIGRPT